jgi:hypothetical protein
VVPLDAPLMEVAIFTSTDRFARMTLDEKAPYLEKMQAAFMEDPQRFDSIPAEQRNVAQRNVGQALMDLRMKQYFALTTQKEKTAFIDAQIALMQEMMGKMMIQRLTKGKSASSSEAKDSPGPPRGMGPRTPAEQKKRLEETDSVRLAMMAQYIGAMHKRMEEKGMKFPSPPR